MQQKLSKTIEKNDFYSDSKFINQTIKKIILTAGTPGSRKPF